MEIKAIVDRIEGEWAVLLVRDDEKVRFNLPVVFLAGTREGDHVTMTITVDAASTDEARQQASDLIGKLKMKNR